MLVSGEQHDDSMFVYTVLRNDDHSIFLLFKIFLKKHEHFLT